MARQIQVLVVAQDPAQLAYLETVLQLEAPGHFKVSTRTGVEGTAGGHDLVLLEVDATLPAARRTVATVLQGAGSVPVVVVSRWSPGLDGMHRLMRAGAEDVLVLAELTAQRLAAAVLKAIDRRARWVPARGRQRGDARLGAITAVPFALRSASPPVGRATGAVPAHREHKGPTSGTRGVASSHSLVGGLGRAAEDVAVGAAG